ncbi:MAG: cytochrome c oxidase assembly protein [Opitutales bacterium]|jgi:putative membrane protein|nr:cytochrome c oxidase assembly protein [Opitutales bacterium]MDP4642976.1 cytochrome c oxidase assembly protein [Opitutales bacterium]MDP4776518.1 cytochrome c oxidase assembly protein [Opitutales bacterium]MDP4879457.1 cytochrome c oxidase assembly protein [Opitutales bacterium]MDP4884434.1 cytochrome c oxidase assembly protein [Opitutales bacterium]
MQLHWHTEPLLLISLLLVGWLYALGTGPLRSRIALGEAFPTGKAVLFYCGLIITYLAVGSPLDQIGEQFLFCAHMTQHMLLIYLAPTLFIFGTPAWLIDWLLKPEAIRKVMSVLTHPLFGGFVFTFVYTAWHVPVLYELALHDKRIHILEHWTMFGLGILMLWPYLTLSKRVPRRAFGLRMVAIFLLMVGQLPVFAFLTFAGEAIYPTYLWAPRIIDLNPLNDQILGGIIMKVVNMGFSLTILGTAFYAWAKSEEAPPAQVTEEAPAH